MTKGENVDVIWKPDATQLIVMTNQGFLHFYNVVYKNTPMLAPELSSTHHYEKGPGEGVVPNYTLSFQMVMNPKFRR
jgi:hypothetical protein